jgi:hypothetical protein
MNMQSDQISVSEIPMSLKYFYLREEEAKDWIRLHRKSQDKFRFALALHYIEKLGVCSVQGGFSNTVCIKWPRLC